MTKIAFLLHADKFAFNYSYRSDVTLDTLKVVSYLHDLAWEEIKKCDMAKELEKSFHDSFEITARALCARMDTLHGLENKK